MSLENIDGELVMLEVTNHVLTYIVSNFGQFLNIEYVLSTLLVSKLFKSSSSKLSELANI